MHAIGCETELRVMVRNELHELPATLFNMVEIGFVERTDPLARLRLVGHPPRPIEAIHEVVHIAKVDHGWATKSLVQRHDMRRDIADRVCLAEAQQTGRKIVHVPEDIIGKLV